MSPISAAATADLPEIRGVLPGDRARDIIARDRAVLSPSYTRPYPLVVARGEGALITDVDGNRFLDFNAGIAVAATGHCHPRVVAAIRKQSEQLIHMSGTDFYYENMVELAEKLARSAPGPERKRVYFGNSGTEAVEAAMKLARYATGRDKFIAFYGGFHGRTYGSLSLTGSKPVQKRAFGPMVPGVHHVPFPNCYRCPQGRTPGACPIDDASIIEEQLFKTVLSPDEVAAIFVEPIQGEGGYVIPPPEFLAGLRRIADAHGILLVFDEIQSGMGRTGKMWAADHTGVAPDILCTAKGIASGMPLSAMIARADLMQWTPGAHASTFGGNPVCVAAALATMALLEEELIENARRVGDHIMNRIRDWPQRFPVVGAVRGRGLMIGFEVVRDQATREIAPDWRDQLEQLAFERGLLILGAGKSAIRLCPPLVITEAQADFAVDTLEQCLRLLAAAR